MKCQGKILAVKGNLFKAEVDSDKLKVGMVIEVKTGKKRSLAQNNLLWVYYSHVCDKCGLWEDVGMTPLGLHDSMKRFFLSERTLVEGRFKLIFVGSSTDLTKLEMMQFITKIDQKITEFYHINTSAFFATYQNLYAGE